MIDDYQMKELWGLLAFCGAAGVPWLIAHGLSRIAHAHRRAVRFVVMSAFTCLWILFLWPMTGRGSRAALPAVMSIVPWWTAIVIGILIERKKEDGAEPRPAGYRR